jgi:hypothetical protein
MALACYIGASSCCCTAARYLAAIHETKCGIESSLTAVTKLGRVVLHKAKRNNNLSFSKGKTWSLEDMRGLEVIGVSLPAVRFFGASSRAADRLCADDDYSALPLADGQGAGPVSLPQLCCKGLSHLHEE